MDSTQCAAYYQKMPSTAKVIWFYTTQKTQNNKTKQIGKNTTFAEVWFHKPFLYTICKGPLQLSVPRQVPSLVVCTGNVFIQWLSCAWSGRLHLTAGEATRCAVSQPANFFKHCYFIGCLSTFTLQSTLTFCSREAAEPSSQSEEQLLQYLKALFLLLRLLPLLLFSVPLPRPLRGLA